jgi:hypothetical protein
VKPCIIAVSPQRRRTVSKSRRDSCKSPEAFVIPDSGRGCGTLEPGRYINYDGLVMSNLWLSLLDRMGVSVERHGDSTGRLPSLSA